MRPHLVSLFTLQAVSCATLSTEGQPPIDSVWENPQQYDGRIFDVVVYPSDFLEDPERYVMCLDACVGERARHVSSVLIPRITAQYSGFEGDRPVRIRVKFDASCFKSERVCLMDHRPYIFVEQ